MSSSDRVPRPRGIYALPCLGVTGEEVLVVVDSQGRQIGQWSPAPGRTDFVWDRLTALLDAIDPPAPVRAPLALVGGGATRPRWTSRART
jgi:hypothetical protein